MIAGMSSHLQCLGLVLTDIPIIVDFSQTENDKLKEDIPLRRFGQPHEVADAAVFLAQNEYANNCVINLDGGLSAL